VEAVTLRALLALALALSLVGCKKEDPYRELVEGEDLGTGVTLQTNYSNVPAIIAENLGKPIAERNVSTDSRYYEFADTYFDYAFIVADLDQNGRVDAVMVVTYALSGDREGKVKRFSTVFPQVRTKTGITIGSTLTDVAEGYGTHQQDLTHPSWVHSSAGHLYFFASVDQIGGIWLVDDDNYKKPVGNIIGRNLPENF